MWNKVRATYEGKSVGLKVKGQSQGSTPGGRGSWPPLRKRRAGSEVLLRTTVTKYGPQGELLCGVVSLRREEGQTLETGPTCASLWHFHGQALSVEIAGILKLQVRARRRRFTPREL